MSTEKTAGGVRVRVFFPDKAWERLTAGADVMGMENRRFVEDCALIGLRIFEMMLINPMSARIQEAHEQHLEEGLKEVAEELDARR